MQTRSLGRAPAFGGPLSRRGLLLWERYKTLSVADSAAANPCKGEEGALALYREGGYDGICSDDRKSVAMLRTLGVPYLTPTTLLVVLARRGALRHADASATLESLAGHVSDDEYTVGRLALETLRERGSGQ